MSKPRLRMLPDQRRAQIAQVARTIIVEQGGGALTLRAVAAGCNVSLAAIQHHFPDKRELLEEVIESITSEYEQRYANAICATASDPAEKLRQFISFLICDDIKLRSTAGFFYEFWTMSFRDPFAEEAMTRLYDAQLVRIRDMVKSINVNLSNREALTRAGLIVAAADGLMMTTGAGKNTILVRESAADFRMVDLLMTMVRQPASVGEDSPLEACQLQ